MRSDPLIRSTETARILAITVPALHKSHERFLKPIRNERGHRLYLREAVIAYAAARDAERDRRGDS